MERFPHFPWFVGRDFYPDVLRKNPREEEGHTRIACILNWNWKKMAGIHLVGKGGSGQQMSLIIGIFVIMMTIIN